MPPTIKFFWCEHCRAEIPFRGYATKIVQKQADHLWDEHGIDIHEPERKPVDWVEEASAVGDPR